eukprot:gene30356-36680_t
MATEVHDGLAKNADVYSFDKFEVAWKDPLNLTSVTTDVVKMVESIPLRELLSQSRALYRAVPWDSSDRAQRAYDHILKIVSLSAYVCSSQDLNPYRDTIWGFWTIESDVLDVIMSIFTCPNDLSTSLRKLALDLGFSLLTNTLNFEDDTYGFTFPFDKIQAKLLTLLGMYLECFMVTSPTLFPFMPSPHYADIRYPPSLDTNCAGKVCSLVGYGKGEVQVGQVCNYKVGARGQPWGGEGAAKKITTMQLVNTLHLVLRTRDIDGKHEEKDDAMASVSTCQALLEQFKRVFGRIGAVAPQLLHSDKGQNYPYTVGKEQKRKCYVCCQALDKKPGVLSVFKTVFLSPLTSASPSAHIKTCSLCQHVTCLTCVSTQLYEEEKVCVLCAEVVREVHLGLGGGMLGDDDEGGDGSDEALDILTGRGGRRVDEICCSMLLPPDLLRWRDEKDD